MRLPGICLAFTLKQPAVCCEVLGICRSIWNKFNFDCCERYRTPRQAITITVAACRGYYNIMLSKAFLPYTSCSAQS